MTDQEFALAAERYMDTIFRVAYSYLRSKSDADDVTQDVLIQLYKTDPLPRRRASQALADLGDGEPVQEHLSLPVAQDGGHRRL